MRELITHPSYRAYTLPFILFMILLQVGNIMDGYFKGYGPLLLAEPKYLIYPLQTLFCGLIIATHWRHYDFKFPRHLLFTLFIAILVLAIWVSPQWLLGEAPRTQGFDPTIFEKSPFYYWLNLLLRFCRLVIIVPLLEEIFWRGFLLRYLINEDFLKVRLGAFSWSSFFLVSLFFGFAHWGPDFKAAIITGALFNIIAYRTKSLSSCVIAHAVTNLLLGFYILKTGQWGFW